MSNKLKSLGWHLSKRKKIWDRVSNSVPTPGTEFETQSKLVGQKSEQFLPLSLIYFFYLLKKICAWSDGTCEKKERKNKIFIKTLPLVLAIQQIIIRDRAAWIIN
jgi:hypothetical protein